MTHTTSARSLIRTVFHAPLQSPGRLCLLLLAALLSGPGVADESGGSFIAGGTPIVELATADEQADAWAMCTFAYGWASSLAEKSGRDADYVARLKNLGNGASVALLVTLLADRVSSTPDITGEQFKAHMQESQAVRDEKYGKVVATLKPLLGPDKTESEKENVYKKLASTTNDCNGNIEAMQLYAGKYQAIQQSRSFEEALGALD